MTDLPTETPLPERRVEERQLVRILATAREFSRSPSQVVVTDLSEHGCRLSGYALNEGAKVWIEFSSLAPLEAEVIWRSGETVGCRFDEPLGPLRLTLAGMTGSTE